LGKNGTRDDLAKYLAEGNSVDAIGKHGLTIVCEAIKFKNIAMIRACIERHASLSKTVYMAVQNRRADLIELLVAAGAHVNERNEYGETPLKYAVGTALPGAEGVRNRQVRDLLIKLGAVK
jgi:ankyrin repeat protein